MDWNLQISENKFLECKKCTNSDGFKSKAIVAPNSTITEGHYSFGFKNMFFIQKEII